MLVALFRETVHIHVHSFYRLPFTINVVVPTLIHPFQLQLLNSSLLFRWFSWPVLNRFAGHSHTWITGRAGFRLCTKMFHSVHLELKESQFLIIKYATISFCLSVLPNNISPFTKFGSSKLICLWSLFNVFNKIKVTRHILGLSHESSRYRLRCQRAWVVYSALMWLFFLLIDFHLLNV